MELVLGGVTGRRAETLHLHLHHLLHLHLHLHHLLLFLEDRSNVMGEIEMVIIEEEEEEEEEEENEEEEEDGSEIEEGTGNYATAMIKQRSSYFRSRF